MHTLRCLSILAVSIFSTLVPAGCATSVVAPEEQPQEQPAEPAKRALGAACAFDTQCATERCTGDVVEGTCGECVEIQPLGASCTGPHQGCSISAVCEGGVCRSTRKIVGETCTFGPKGEDREDCDVDLYCAHAGKLTDPGTCVARLAVGETCDGYLTGCVRGAICNTAHTCAIPVPGTCELWSSCGASTYCDANRRCQEGTLDEGAPCGIVDGEFIVNECKPGLVCGSLAFPNGGGGPGSEETCLPLPGEGEPCVHETCGEGLFCKRSMEAPIAILPRCELLRGEGEACRNDSYYHIGCAAGLECRKDTCQIACR